MPDPYDDELHQPTHCNQRPSLLLDMPPELRQMIWVYALGSDIWYTCDRYKPRRKTNTAHFTHKLRNGVDYKSLDHGLALLLTCRQIHSEAHNIPLTRSTFAFNTILTFASWAGHPMARFVTFAEVQLDAMPDREYEGPEAGMAVFTITLPGAATSERDMYVVNLFLSSADADAGAGAAVSRSVWGYGKGFRALVERE